MPTPVTTHPTAAVLAEFVLGKLADADDAEVGAHLAECQECQDRAAAAQPADTLVSLLAAAGTRGDTGHTVPPVPASEATPTDFAQTRAWDAGVRPEPGAAGADDAVPEGLAHHPRYRLVRLLGSGGMGVVWLAEHTVMGRPVALKVIRPEFLARAGAVERFRREVRAAAQLNHPNIATAYDADEAGGSHFLVMEYVSGEVLLDVVKRGPLPTAEACRAVRDAARGLAHAHAAGLIHRDVKPANLIRAADGTVKVLDFGLVGMEAGAGGLTGENMVMGTPDYIAPEQATDAHTADARSDVYALGCTLYHLLAGRVPFPGGTTLQKLDAHRDTARAPDPVAGISVKLARVLSRMAAKAPADRYPTAEAAADALDRFCVTLDEGPQTAAEVPAPPRSRRRLAVAAGVLFALCAAAGAAVVQHRIKTDTGELVIETTDDDVEVVVKQGGQVVEVYDPKSKQKLVLKSGAYEFEVNGKAAGLVLDIDRATLKRGDVVVARITRRQPVEPPAPVKPIPADRPPGAVERFEGHTGPVHSVALSRDGRTAVSGSGFPYGDYTARVWDVATGRERWCLRDAGMGWVMGVAIAPDGRRALSVCTEGVRLWNLDTGKLVWCEILGVNCHSVAFAPDGKRFVIATGAANGGGDVSARIGDVETGKVWRRLDGHTDKVVHAVFSPDGRRVLSGSADRTLRLWDAATGKSVRTLTGHTHVVTGVAFMPDGKTAVSCAEDRTVRQWNVESGAEIQRFVGHTDRIFGVAVTPDGRSLVSAASDRTARVWAVATGREVGRFNGHADWLWAVAVTPDGRSALTGGGGHTNSGGTWLAGSDFTLRLWPLPAQTPAPAEKP